MAPTRVVAGGGITHSSSSSGIFFQGDAQSQSQTVANSNFTPSFGNSSSQVLGNVPSSAPSIGGSSLVTDANSGLPGAPHLQRSASFNTDSYMRLPASPLSFSSNNISISGSSAMDGSSVAQQSPNQGASTATSLPTSRMVQANFLKKPRLEIKQEDVLQQQVLQQLLQRQDSMQLQAASNPQLQALIQQQRLRQQQQLQAISPSQRAQLLQHQHQLQLRQQQLQQQGLQQPVSGVKRLHDSGVCSRRLMQYLYHQRQRPPDNTIAYWRKFVAEYYSPRAKKKWCLSLYDNVGHHSLGVFPQAAVDAWQCDICNSKSGRGFEATFEVLPRLNEIKFGSGVIDELLFLDLPRECRYPSGIMMLEYLKAVQESVYEQIRVIREGHLRIIFTPDLKILSWEFCARRHEELLPRRLVAPQVNQLLQVAQKCQSTIAEGGDDGVSQQDLQTNSNMVVTAGRQLARSLELQSLNDLGFSKRYVRCLQISEVVNTMKDLIDFCGEHKAGPIDGLKNIPRHPAQLQKMQEIRNLPTVKLETQNPGTPNNNNNSQTGLNNTLGRGTLTSSAQAALALTNYQTLLTKQNSTQQQQQHQQPEQETTSKLPQSSSSAAAATATLLPGNLQQSYTRSSSFKAPPNSDSSAAAGGGNNNGIGQQKTDDFPHNLHLSDDLDIAAHDFTENGFFSSDLDDNLGYDWKA